MASIHPHEFLAEYVEPAVKMYQANQLVTHLAVHAISEMDYDRDADAQARRRALAQAVPDDNRDFNRLTFRAIVTDPVRGSMRSGVKALGREIHRLGGLNAMHASLEAVAAMDDNHYSLRGGIMDSAWNGIGDDKAKLWS